MAHQDGREAQTDLFYDMHDTQNEARGRIPESDLWGVGTGLFIISILMRAASYPITTSDYTGFLSNWFDILKSHPGLSAFQNSFSDYTPLYLYFLKILTFFDIPSLYSIKSLSLLFDLMIVACAVLILRAVSRNSYSAGRLYLAAAIVFSVPTLLLNSSLWGQSDAIYAAGCIASLYCILTERRFLAALAFGFAISMKLQAIFFLPVLIGYYLRRPRDLWNLLVVPIVYIASLVPAWLGGAPFGQLFFTYIYQSGEYKDLSVSSPSVFAFFNQSGLSVSTQHALFVGGLVTATLCSLGLIILASRVAARADKRGIIFLAMLSALILPFFLPRMHERYFYLADLFAVLYALEYPRKWYFPALIVSASLLSYMPYLSGQVALLSSLHIDLRVSAFILLSAIGIAVAGFFISSSIKTVTPST